MDLQKLCETYEIIHAKLSSELEKGGYDRAVVDELSAGITGKLNHAIDDTYLPFVEYITKKKRSYDARFTAKNLLKLLQSGDTAFCLTCGLEAPLALICIYLVDGTLTEATYCFARDSREAEDSGVCDSGYKIGIGYSQGVFSTLKTTLRNNRTYRTAWKEKPQQSADTQEPAGDFIIENGILKKYTGTQIDVIIPDGVVGIGNKAFNECATIVSIKIPDSVRKIGENSFQSCKSLQSITIPKGTKRIPYGAFYGCTSLNNISLPNTVTRIQGGAFGDCPSLKEIDIPNSVKEIEGDPFCEGTALLQINVGEKNTAYKSVDGNLYTKDGKILVFYAKGKKEKSFIVPEGVETINTKAFKGCIYLESVSISNDVTSIQEEAFSNCPALKNVIMGAMVNSIRKCAFYECASLTDVNLNNSLSIIAMYAFMGCKALRSIRIPNSTTQIFTGAFANCPSLTIYCEQESKPEGWWDKWNVSKCSVIWGYRG